MFFNSKIVFFLLKPNTKRWIHLLNAFVRMTKLISRELALRTWVIILQSYNEILHFHQQAYSCCNDELNCFSLTEQWFVVFQSLFYCLLINPQKWNSLFSAFCFSNGYKFMFYKTMYSELAYKLPYQLVMWN